MKKASCSPPKAASPLPSARVRSAGGSYTVTDRLFPESKEIVDGETEIRQLYEQPAQ